MSALDGPPPIETGTAGTLRVGGLVAGALTEWRIVVSPTTNMPTLIGNGRFGRYFAQAIGGRAVAEVTPHAGHAYIGRPRPPAPAPFHIVGTLAELTAARAVIASGEIVRG